ncbi:ADP-ribosylglycohydrolase family protein [candidate division KSB1 bacterium]|nr:ADP-ribosylglycohydrolase family protein [candidate division KSB1 bacterium]MBL7093202.1 ADP-ribosylglycohydrolase family protein [candidate division KSB1 bacterium]
MKFRRNQNKILLVMMSLLMVGIIFSLAIGKVQAQDVELSERRLPVSEYRDKMMAGWIGQMVGVGWGAPTEFRYQSKIIPEDKVPVWQPAMVNQFSQDDIYVEMTFLRSLEEYGFDVSIRQAGIDFARSGYMLWHANKAGRDNLRKGIAPPNCSHPQFSDHSDDIDYQIEADYSGLIAPGLPNIVIALGEKFGRLVNYGDGLYAGQFVGAMYAEAFFEDDPLTIIEAGLRSIPAESQYAEMVCDVIQWHQENPDDWQETWQLINEKYHKNLDYRRYSCSDTKEDFNIDAKINGAYILMGMLYGNNDMDQTTVISMRCGQDSDCNPSNAAGVLFTAAGYKNLPQKYISALIQDKKFSFTEYDFPTLIDVCEKLARQAVVKAGGRIETDEEGEDVFVIPVKKPIPSKLEQSWKPGPIADSQFTKDELTQIQGYLILKLVLWLLLVLAIVALKENYKFSALLIALPLVVVLGVWTLLSSFMSAEMLDTFAIGPVIVSMAVGLALLCLVGEKIGKYKWFISYLIAIVILLAAGYSGTVGSNAGRLDAGTKISLMTFFYWAGALLLALTITALNCRKSYSNKRFLGFLLLWSVVSQILFLFLYAGMNWGFVTAILGKLSIIIIVIAIMGSIFGIILYIITLPYLVLIFRSKLYKNRFRSCLRLPAVDKAE